jgi:exodeoxyribonuclease VII large subunit
MRDAILHGLELRRERVKSFGAQLNAYNPLSVLARGYAVVTRKEDGSVVSRVAQTEPGQQIQIRVSDGQIDAEIVNPKSEI